MTGSTDKPRTRRCFIIGAHDAYEAAIRAELSRVAVDGFTTWDIAGSRPLSGLIVDAIKRADFVIAILRADPTRSSVLFEIGIAYALGKPLAAVVPPGAENLPAELTDLQIVRASPDDSEAFRFLITQLSEAAAHSRKSRTSGNTTRRPSRPARDLSGLWLERTVQSALARSGVSVEAEARTANRGADFAFWSADLESIGNPVLVEVKASRSPSTIRDGADQLATYMERTRAELGLLIYPGPRADTPVGRILERGLILYFTIDELIDAVDAGRLTDAVKERRNRLVHGHLA